MYIVCVYIMFIYSMCIYIVCVCFNCFCFLIAIDVINYLRGPIVIMFSL